MLHIPRSLIFWKLFQNIWLPRKKEKREGGKEGKGEEKTFGEEKYILPRRNRKRRRKIFGEGKYLVHTRARAV